MPQTRTRAQINDCHVWRNERERIVADGFAQTVEHFACAFPDFGIAIVKLGVGALYAHPK
jgi:hypothetical protein